VDLGNVMIEEPEAPESAKIEEVPLVKGGIKINKTKTKSVSRKKVKV
jgi:hypothetical protein